ncbi:hypothetical protein AAVH_17051 [Aphelenchoides avenae]|nr:hypothetical protein AAVH_17051 [Aphelenchus avenae]
MPIKHYKNGQGVKPPAQSSSDIFVASSDGSDESRTLPGGECGMEDSSKQPLLNCGSHDKEAVMVQLPDCSTVVVCDKCKAEIKSADEKEDASRYDLFPEASDSEP